MKIFCSLIIFLAIFLSCNDDDKAIVNEVDCTLTEGNPDWTRERFNTNYTIKSPDNYAGGIQQRFKGTTFEKRRNDEAVVVQGGFCDPLSFPCSATDYYGESIEHNLDSVAYKNLSGNMDYLNKKIKICKDQVNIGYFFYTDSSGGTFRNSYGRLYLLDINDSTIKRAGNVEFANSGKEEVVEILESFILE